MPAARPLFVAGNWKMHLTGQASLALADALATRIPTDADCSFIIAPGAFALERVAKRIAEHPRIAAFAQACHGEPSGAFTGWLAAEQAKDAGAAGMLAGHSERRRFAQESHRDIARQLAAARRCGLRPILCIGEDLAERERGATEAVLTTQLDAELIDCTAADLSSLLVAYEPVWAIGTGRSASPEDVQTTHATLRSWLESRWGKAGSDIPLLYGGSVTEQSADALGRQADVDGFLVGGQSLKAEAFVAIAQKLTEAKK